MEWTSEKLCTTVGDYDLMIERFKHGYQYSQSTNTWKWRVIYSGVVMSQGTAENAEAARKMAESKIPLNS